MFAAAAAFAASPPKRSCAAAGRSSDQTATATAHDATVKHLPFIAMLLVCSGELRTPADSPSFVGDRGANGQ